MTSTTATDATRITTQKKRYLEVDRDNRPIDKQVPRTYQTYNGTGAEAVQLDGSDQFICESDLPAGPLVLSVGGQVGIRNLLGRIIRLTFPLGIINDVDLDVAPGVLTVTQNGVPSNGYTFAGPMTPFDAELQFYEDSTVFVALRCVAGGGPVTVGDIVGGTDGKVIRFIGTTATAVDEVLLDNIPAGANNQIMRTVGGQPTWQNQIVLTNVPAGANGEVLTTNAGNVVWQIPAAPPTFTQVKKMSVIKLSTSVFANDFIIPFDAVLFNNTSLVMNVGLTRLSGFTPGRFYTISFYVNMRNIDIDLNYDLQFEQNGGPTFFMSYRQTGVETVVGNVIRSENIAMTAMFDGTVHAANFFEWIFRNVVGPLGSSRVANANMDITEYTF